MTQPSRLAITLSSIFAGAAAGAAVSTCFVWLSWREWSFLHVFGDPRNIVFAGSIVGPIVGLIITWRLSSRIDETWRRAATTVTGGFGAFGGGAAAFPISMYSMMVMNPFVSEGLLPAYFVVMAVVCFMALRVARNQHAAGAA